MEKYGVCNKCQGRPSGADDDLSDFVKTACGDYKCPNCGQIVSTALTLGDSVAITDKKDVLVEDVNETPHGESDDT